MTTFMPILKQCVYEDKRLEVNEQTNKQTNIYINKV
jgi:hypothetical protein